MANQNKLKNVIKEIENFIKTDTCEACKEIELENCEECNYKIILDIINESKGE